MAADIGNGRERCILFEAESYKSKFVLSQLCNLRVGAHLRFTALS